MSQEILTQFKNYASKIDNNYISIYFSENYQMFSSGLAVVVNDSYKWIENTNYSVGTPLTEQYGFDSQGYGEMICIAEIYKNTDSNNLFFVGEDGEDTFHKIPAYILNKEEAMEFLNKFKNDTEFIIFIESSFRNSVYKTKKIKTVWEQ